MSTTPVSISLDDLIGKVDLTCSRTSFELKGLKVACWKYTPGTVGLPSTLFTSS